MPKKWHPYPLGEYKNAGVTILKIVEGKNARTVVYEVLQHCCNQPTTLKHASLKRKVTGGYASCKLCTFNRNMNAIVEERDRQATKGEIVERRNRIKLQEREPRPILLWLNAMMHL